MSKAWTRIAILSLVVAVVSGCDLRIYQIEPTPTPAPAAPPGSACAVVTVGRLQAWMGEKLPRSEREVPGGVVFLDTPRVTNCDANTVYFQIVVGYQRGDVTVELGLLEQSLNLRYDENQGSVCLDLLGGGALSSPNLSPQGVEQVGQQVQVGDTKAGISGVSSLDQMPPAVREQFDQAVSRSVTIDGGEQQGIGTEAAGILLDWAVGDLVSRLNAELAKLLGACIQVP